MDMLTQDSLPWACIERFHVIVILYLPRYKGYDDALDDVKTIDIPIRSIRNTRRYRTILKKTGPVRSYLKSDVTE